MDDIVIEDKLGLYREGDFVKLIRVSGSGLVSEKQFLAEAPPSYILKTDLDICPVPAKTEAALKEKAQPLPCPFCGAYPEIILLNTDDPGIICGKIVCLNPQCPVQPEICGDHRPPGSVDEESFRSALISQWNTRPANAG
jgi:hypothetical protein